MDCKSTNIRNGRISKKICPNCKSDDILTIIEKRKQLKQEFQTTIQDFRYGYYKLKKFLDDCRVHKQELITLRTLGYKHDAKIEHSLLWIYNTVNKVKLEIMNHFQKDFGFIRSRIYRFIDIDTWNPLNFYEIESIINQIKENVNTFKNFVDISLKPMIANLIVLKSKISVIQYYKLIYDEYEEELNLRINELPVCAFKHIHFVKFEDNELPPKRGVLFITNKRIIFIYKKGLINKVKEKLFKIELKSVQNAFITGRIFKKLKIITDKGILVLDGANKILGAIVHYLNIAMNFQNYSNDDNFLIQRLGKIDIEISDLKNNINRYISKILNREEISRENFIIDKNINNRKMNEIFNKNINFEQNNSKILSNIDRVSLNNLKNNAPIVPRPIETNRMSNQMPQMSQLPQMPQPGSINITIPINQNTDGFKMPFAQVLQDHEKYRRDIETKNENINKNSIESISRNTNIIRPHLHNNPSQITTAQTRPIIKLYEDKFAIEKTLENIDRLFNSGKITPEAYFKQYRPLQKELFTIIKLIEEKEKY
ncbi:MAG: hypothetical protein ACTSQO_12060 [Candidatus Helarchaeota archaeon]